MPQPSPSFGSFMAENVATSRWYLYRLRLLGVFFAMLAVLSPVHPIGLPTRVVVNALVFSLVFSSVFYLGERYGPRFTGPRYESVKIILFVVLVMASCVILFRIGRNRDVIFMNCGPTTSHP
jgi:hypothetical protein